MPGVPRVEIASGYAISRLLKGGWQLAGGHGPVDETASLDDMAAFLDAGITTFDCADIYTGVEALIGRFVARVRARRGEHAAAGVQVHTKYVHDLDRLATLSRSDVERTIERSRTRLAVSAVDLVQLHWWDYDVPGYLDAARWLDDLRRDGRVRHLGLTNFDSPRLAEFLAAGIPIVSHQVQYSLLDRRPEREMAALCAEHRVSLLAYGVLAGGFLSERWLGAGPPAPPLENRSLVKYRLIIEESGGWDYFQALLHALQAIAQKHQVGIGTVAIRWTLDRPGVAGVIVGARHRRHLPASLAALDLSLDEEDRRRIEAVLASSASPAGDVYALERIRDGRHGRIMRYNLQHP